jgi:hypothetical protein
VSVRDDSDLLIAQVHLTFCCLMPRGRAPGRVLGLVGDVVVVLNVAFDRVDDDIGEARL